jgi:trans-aconitate methyltransferase
MSSLHNESVTSGHWDDAYSHGDTTRSWYRRESTWSLHMLDECDVSPASSVIDVGGGASTLVDALIARGQHDVTVLDISATSLEIARERLGAAGEGTRWVVADLLTWQPDRTFDVWHDRALLHFLVDDAARHAYLQVLNLATHSGSVAVFATFAPDGPEHCSGLPVARYDAHDLAELLGVRWRLCGAEREEHVTPGGAVQPFTWAAFRRS